MTSLSSGHDTSSQQLHDGRETTESADVAIARPDAAAAFEEDAGPGSMDSSIRRLAQLIVKDQETGCEYMIADFGEPHSSSQKLVNLSTNETRVFQYNTIEEQERARDHALESLSALSTCATSSQAPSEAASERRMKGMKSAGKLWYSTTI